MKKLLLMGLILASSFASFAQEADTIKKAIQKDAESIGHGGVNELKFNLLYAIIGMPEITYERLITDNMGVGVSLLVGVDESAEYQFGLTPHFRIYFGSQKANGFFIEGSSSVITHRDYDDDYKFRSVDRTNFGLGAAGGRKFLTRNGFLGEVSFGIGRYIGNHNGEQAYFRGGLTLGKRF
ncbi:MAG TPA: hypothetical protein VL088_08775 [Pedobacter sp.]|nr:hypothetical protein [Pedobacter sp.]